MTTALTVYACSIVATRERDGAMEVGSCPLGFLAAGPIGAEQRAWVECRRRYPAADGWTNHRAAVIQITAAVARDHAPRPGHSAPAQQNTPC